MNNVTRDLIHVDWCYLKSKALKDFIQEEFSHIINHYTILGFDSIIDHFYDGNDENVRVPVWIIEALLDEGLTQEELDTKADKIFFYIDW